MNDLLHLVSCYGSLDCGDNVVVSLVFESSVGAPVVARTMMAKFESRRMKNFDFYLDGLECELDWLTI